MVTRQYHSVSKLTYKKWRIANRVSLILEYDTEKHAVKHIPVIQEDNNPRVQESLGISKKIVLVWILFLFYAYKFPYNLYNPIEKINSFVVYKVWRGQILLFQIRQYGLCYSIKRAIPLLKRFVKIE